MRKGLVFAGAATLVTGLVVFLVAVVGIGQATAAFFSCLNGYPTYPMYGLPAACANAMGAVAMYQSLEDLGGVLGLVGVVLLIIGLVLQPERPATMPVYPPPVYVPPYGAPPQEPEAPR